MKQRLLSTLVAGALTCTTPYANAQSLQGLENDFAYHMQLVQLSDSHEQIYAEDIDTLANETANFLGPVIDEDIAHERLTHYRERLLDLGREVRQDEFMLPAPKLLRCYEISEVIRQIDTHIE